MWSAWRSKPHALLWCPTGAGKTQICLHLIKRCIEAKPGVKVLILLDKVELLNQTVKQLKEIFPSVSEVCGTNGRNDTSGVIVAASIQTIVLMGELPVFNIVWIDEVHGADFEHGAYAEVYRKISHEKLRLVGTTATPWRASGPIYGKKRFFESVDYHISMQKLIDNGHLVPPVCKRPDHQFETSSLRVTAGDFNEKDLGELALSTKASNQVRDALERLKGREKVVWACINIEHAIRIHSEIGESSALVHSLQTRDERLRNIRDFEHGGKRHLAFVSIVAEGYDFPPIDGIVLLRPTRSPNRYVQVVGRGLRPFEHKRDCLVLDYGRVIESLGPVDDPIIPTRGKGKAKEDSIPPMKFCPKCFSYCSTAVKECRDCGYIFPVVENLTKKAFDGKLLAGEGPRTINAHRVVLRKHVAKSGSNCICVDYGMVGLSEYFIFDNTWSKRLMESRLTALGVKVYPTLDATVNQTVKGSYEIEYKKDGKYFKVVKIRKLDPEGNPPRTQFPGSLFLG